MSISRLLTSIKQEPLVHLLVIGSCLFVWQSRNSTSADGNANDVIRVEEQQLVRYLQYQAGIPDRDKAQQRLSVMSSEQLDVLTQAFVEEEVLVREARLLGLDKNDRAMRQRLVQRARYALQAFAVDQTDPAAEEILDYFQRNQERYRVEPVVSFRHVFFSTTHRTSEAALKSAISATGALKQPSDDNAANALGDRFLYHRSYARRTQAEVESHFGEDMALAVFELQPDATQWQGPIASEHGWHLVQLTDVRKGYLPELDEVVDTVTADLLFERQQRQLAASIKQLVGRYDIVSPYTNHAGSPRQEFSEQ